MASTRWNLGSWPGSNVLVFLVDNIKRMLKWPEPVTRKALYLIVHYKRSTYGAYLVMISMPHQHTNHDIKKINFSSNSFQTFMNLHLLLMQLKKCIHMYEY